MGTAERKGAKPYLQYEKALLMAIYSLLAREMTFGSTSTSHTHPAIPRLS